VRGVDWEAYLDGVAPAVGLPVDPGWRAGVVRFLGLAAEMAATLEAVDLADDHLDLDAVLVLPEAP
jgi:hypothetical protein